MSVDQDITISNHLDKNLCIETNPEPLLRALEDLGITNMGTCEEIEPGFMCIEFPTTEDAEEFLTLLVVTLESQNVRDPEVDDWLTSRILGIVGHDDSPVWSYHAYPLDTLSYLDPEPPKIKSSLPFAVCLKIAIKFPLQDYPRILELITRCSKLSFYCR